MEENTKKIEVVRLRARDLKTGFGNPRKIKKEKFEELKKSMEDYGDFGLFLIDEKNNVIAGNQRLQVLLQTNPDTEILCKRLIGYTESELRSINIKDNVHAGEWDREKDKLLKRIYHAYHKASYFEEVWKDLEPMFQDIKVGQKMVDVNLAFTVHIMHKMGIDIPVYLESLEDDLPEDPDDAIIHMCKITGCDKYLVGVHGGQYMNFDKYKEAGIELVYSDFDKEKDLTGNYLSILDYIMNYGYVIPKEWK